MLVGEIDLPCVESILHVEIPADVNAREGLVFFLELVHQGRLDPVSLIGQYYHTQSPVEPALRRSAKRDENRYIYYEPLVISIMLIPEVLIVMRDAHLDVRPEAFYVIN